MFSIITLRIWTYDNFRTWTNVVFALSKMFKQNQLQNFIKGVEGFLFFFRMKNIKFKKEHCIAEHFPCELWSQVEYEPKKKITPPSPGGSNSMFVLISDKLKSDI